MKNIRIIPRLDIKGPNLVKGIHLEGLRVLGSPRKFAKYYYENGADELIYMDVVASLYERNSLKNIISETAKEIFIPLTVGGGLRTIEDINAVLRAGADKVALNTAAIKNPTIIREASNQFGSSTIVVTIEAIRQKDGRHLAFIDNGREHTGIEVTEWAQQVEALGAGEIVLTSVDREGTGEGFDIALIEKVAKAISIPLIAHGGAGKTADLKEAIEAGSDAISLASVLHYEYVNNNAFSIDKTEEGNTEFLRSGKNFNKIQARGLTDIKKELLEMGFSVRYPV
jgi:cyclase